MKRLACISSLLTAMLLTLATSCYALEAGSWPMFRQNPRHTGAVGSDDIRPPLKLKWKIPLHSIIDSSPAISGKYVYVGTDAGYLYCIDVLEGKVKWKFDAGDTIISSPCIGYGNVYFGCYDGRLYALNAKTGELVFTYQTGARIKSSPAVADDLVYFGSLDWYVYALNAKNGKLAWKTKTKWGVASSPTVFEDRLYIGSNDKFVYCLETKTGKVLYTYQTRGDVYASSTAGGGGNNPAVIIADEAKEEDKKKDKDEDIIDYQKMGGSVVSAPTLAGEMLYFGSFDKHIYEFSNNANRSSWQVKLGDTISSTPAFIKSDPPKDYKEPVQSAETSETDEQGKHAFVAAKIIVGSRDGSIYAFSSNDGEQLWKTTTNGFIYSSAAVTKKYVFIGSWDNYFYMLDINTGAIVWKYKANGWIRSSAALYNGVVFFGSRDGYLYAFVSEHS